jgi:hypothetical protein
MIEHFILLEYMSGCMIRTNDYMLREKCINYAHVLCSLHLLSCVLYRVFLAKHLHYRLLVIITLFKIYRLLMKIVKLFIGKLWSLLRNVKDKHEKLCHVWSLISDESASECDAGQPRRHLLTTGWSAFVNKKKLVSGDAVLFLR